MAKETTDSSFHNDVISSDVPVLVDFWAPWCGPCRMAAPIIESVGNKVKGKARVFKLNVDENPQVARKYSITGIPTVIVFKDGNVDKQLVGLQTEEIYLKALE